MSSGEGLPSRSSQVSAVKITAKELETKQPHKEKRGGFVLVHAGAGYHSESKAKEYKHVCKRACQKAIEKLQAGALATDAVTAALVELEVGPSIVKEAHVERTISGTACTNLFLDIIKTPTKTKFKTISDVHIY
ncbi:Threonine aspartase 1 [Galemys pyrenaicus]|uniref:Threonine aspartase 1 n=1 Tax=Galemys pyrenaicus TaxID=202257 RepID=A0A8J6AM79_GALPY|nr:Threonine aspartase 1 [Galemys pyrenaicus]